MEERIVELLEKQNEIVSEISKKITNQNRMIAILLMNPKFGIADFSSDDYRGLVNKFNKLSNMNNIFD